MFPNPAENEVSVLMPGTEGQKKTLSLISVSGIVMKKVEVSGSEVAKILSVSDLPKGLYIVEMLSEGKVTRNKLVIQ